LRQQRHFAFDDRRRVKRRPDCLRNASGVPSVVTSPRIQKPGLGFPLRLKQNRLGWLSKSTDDEDDLSI